MDQTKLARLEQLLEKRHKRSLYTLSRTSRKAKALLETGAIHAQNLRDRSRHLLAGAGLTGALLFSSSPLDKLHLPPVPPPIMDTFTSGDLRKNLSQELAKITPHFPTALDDTTAAAIESVIRKQTSITAKAKLDGQSLNHQVGYIGYEQHLQRFPGDHLGLHDDEQVAGIAPGLGAWGYFAKSKNQFTTADYFKEKYYSVAQTLYLPTWNSDFAHLRDWYKYRKILIVNPRNGRAVVTVLADSGPAKWTGKQFGASPEAMKELDLHLGPRKGLVLFLFIDDPEDNIPLGPVTKPLSL